VSTKLDSFATSQKRGDLTDMTSPQYAPQGRATVHSTVQMQWRKALAPQADGHSQQWGIFGAARAGHRQPKEQSVITVVQQGTGHCYQWLLRRANFPHVQALGERSYQWRKSLAVQADGH
jgi:hypothetical protein